MNEKEKKELELFRSWFIMDATAEAYERGIKVLLEYNEPSGCYCPAMVS